MTRTANMLKSEPLMEKSEALFIKAADLLKSAHWSNDDSDEADKLLIKAIQLRIDSDKLFFGPYSKKIWKFK